MPKTASTTTRKLPLLPVVGGLLFVLVLTGALFYLNKPAPEKGQGGPTGEAKAYVRNLQLSDVEMKATENFMKQQVVELNGKLTNAGPRPLQAVEVYCIFAGLDGKAVYRERLPILHAKGQALQPNEARTFRLPFDSVPDGWNQATPQMVIAHIDFAN